MNTIKQGNYSGNNLTNKYHLSIQLRETKF